jgi:hypothetical protein
MITLLLLLCLQDVKPPKGTNWKDTLDAAKSDASSRKAPIFLYSYDKGYDDAVKLNQALEDPKVVAVLKVFSCCFLSRDYNFDKFQHSYIPWIGSSASAQYTPPLMVFGDSKGNAAQEFRVEGKSMDTDQLLEHLFKVLNKLAPDKVENARYEVLLLNTLAELQKKLEDSLKTLDDNLSADKVNVFQDELKNTDLYFRVYSAKVEGLKDKKARTEAWKHIGEMKKLLEKLPKFKGKDIPNFKANLDKAKESLAAAAKALEGVKE